MNDLIYRQQIKHSDIGAIADIVKSSGFFSAEEIDIALELAEEKLTQPHDSSYQFLFAEKMIACSIYLLRSYSRNAFQLWYLLECRIKRYARSRIGKAAYGRNGKSHCGRWRQTIYLETSSRELYNQP